MKKRIGELLVEAGATTENDVREALGHQRSWASNQKLGEVLVSVGKCTPSAVARALSVQFDLPFVKLPEIPERVTQLVPLTYQEEHKLIPFKVETEGKSERLHIAVADPSNLEVVDELRFQLRKTVRIYVAATDDIAQAIAVMKGESLEEIQPLELSEEDAETPIQIERTTPSAPQSWFSGNKDAAADLPEEWSLGPTPATKEPAAAKSPIANASADLDDLFGGSAPSAPAPAPAKVAEKTVEMKVTPPPEAKPPVEPKPAAVTRPVNVLSVTPPPTVPEAKAPVLAPEPATVKAVAPTEDEAHPFTAVVEDSWGDLFPGGEKKPVAESPRSSTEPGIPESELFNSAPDERAAPTSPPERSAPPSSTAAANTPPPPSITPLPMAKVEPVSTATPSASAPKSVSAPTLAGPAPSSAQPPAASSSAPPSATPPPDGSLLGKNAASATSAPAPASSAPPPPKTEAPEPKEKLELSEDDLRILDDIEKLASGAQPSSESEKVKPAQMVATLIRLLIKKGVIEELEFLDELSRK